MNSDVVVAGAGPVGLLLAAELRLAGASVTVLERLTEVSEAIKAGGINARSVQVLARRGLRAQLEAEAAKHVDGFATFARHRAEASPRARFAGHFAGLFLNPEPGFDLPASVVIPQQALERLLGAWVEQLGVTVLRGHEITDLAQDADGVTVHAVAADGPVTVRGVTVRGSYLVGCDGGRSTVRKLAGFAFPGTEPLTTGYQAIVTLEDPASLPLGWNITDTGLCAYGPKPGRILTVAFDGPPADRDAEITTAELQDNLRYVSGADVTITAVQVATRYTDNARQAVTYRKGRVLLAGDAAHVHPPFGGQGLNLGLQDAANLGWKLAATVRGWAPDGLLDTYTTERHPVAARVLANTRAQIAIMRPDPHSRAMRELFGELMTTPGMSERLVNMVQGVDIGYELGPATHPLIGRHVPDLTGIEDAQRLPRPTLFDLAGSAELRAVADGWADRVDVRTLPSSSELSALLVRPDGYVAWACDGETKDTDLEALRHALGNWFGEQLR